MSLELRRFVEKNTITGKYYLGSRLMELGLSAVVRLDVYEVAGPHLRTLVKETGETAHLGVLRDDIPFHDRYRLDIRAESFNLFNWTQFAPPNNQADNPGSFGQVYSQVNQPRLIQFSGRFTF
jgi:hypothetical protein